MTNRNETSSATSGSDISEDPGPVRKMPTPEDPTPNWRTHRELPDDRRHWLMFPSTERYSFAKPTEVRHACRCGRKHEAVVHEDGTMYCQATDQFFIASTDEPELKKMRRAFEDWFIKIVRATELN